MMAFLIFVFSLATLLMFFVSYCRSLTAASARQVLSEEVRDVTHIRVPATREDYGRVMQILGLCPERPDENLSLRAVGLYFDLLTGLRNSFAKLIPALAAWTELEQGACAYFAAVALDRRIAYSREMLHQSPDA